MSAVPKEPIQHSCWRLTKVTTHREISTFVRFSDHSLKIAVGPVCKLCPYSSTLLSLLQNPPCIYPISRGKYPYEDNVKNNLFLGELYTNRELQKERASYS